MKKRFLITIDTEADNQWDPNHPETTENVKYLPRFQELSEKYGFKPVWLSTYEIINNPFFVDYMKDKQDKGLCEIGMHLHAWSTPPNYKLTAVNNERPYLIEYPDDVMEIKIKTMTDLINHKFLMSPVSHRSGRWALNEKYIKYLSKYGYHVDCSITPGVNWESCIGATGIGGPNYSKCSKKVTNIGDGLLEVPVTVEKLHYYDVARIRKPKNILGEARRCIKGRYQWLRPDSSLSYNGLIRLINFESKNNSPYLMFMIHSSELMPEGSPNFKNEIAINKLYENIELVFSYAKKFGYTGITLRDYYKEIIEEKHCEVI